ncbi:hypothetical protein [Deinococcus roseus]|uniref:Uncharacterized protein n=1 Tax=Deinococcus roseus TaxID=392414 RepID=A0ABQ2CWN3_9DEIO|nr:hypothetical protein [Deinococcus roseus]GGJ28376.1 hypothetical protein GCM10008938_13070 [Deinococcus roseus]
MRQLTHILTAAALLSSAAFAASSNTSVSTSATKPAVALGALSAVNGSDGAVASISFGSGALTKNQETDASSLLKFKLASYDNAVSGQSFTLSFGLPSVTGYTFKYKLDGAGTSSSVANLTGTLAAGSSSSAVYVGSGAAAADNASATSVLFTVTADGTASTDLSGNITVTITAN